MIQIFKRTIYNNFHQSYLGLSYKKCILISFNNKYIRVPKYLDLTLEEVIKNKKNIKNMHGMMYVKKKN